MILQIAATLCVVFAVAQDLEQACDRAEASSCVGGKSRPGAALLQTDVDATLQASTAERGDHGDLQKALLLETGKTELAAKSKSRAAPLVGKVNTLVDEVSKLDTEVSGLEKAVGVGRPSSGEAASLPVIPVPAGPPPTPLPADAVPAEDVVEEVPVEGEAAAMLEAPQWPPEDEAFLDGPEGLNLRQTSAERQDYFARRPFATLQRTSSQKTAGRQRVQYSTAGPPRARELRSVPETSISEAANQQPLALMKKSSRAARAPAGSLKSTVSELEGRISDISSRIVSLENEVVGHAVASLLELDSTTKLAEIPMSAAAMNSRVISQQQTRQASSLGIEPVYSNALKSRTLRMEETVDDLKSRAHTLTGEILR